MVCSKDEIRSGIKFAGVLAYGVLNMISNICIEIMKEKVEMFNPQIWCLSNFEV